MSEEKSAGIISGIFATIGFGLIGTTIFSIILEVENNFEVENLYGILSLENASKITIYFVVLLSWALGGAIAGVRTKNSIKGFLSGFFGAFIGSLFILLLYLSSATADLFAIDINEIVGTLPPFIIGVIGIMLAASFSGYGVGKATTVPEKKIRKQKSKKAWASGNKWKCPSCGKNIPAGKMKCPNCGAGAIG